MAANYTYFIAIDPFAACLPQAGLAPLRAKKEDLHVYHIGQNRYQKKLACHRLGVKKKLIPLRLCEQKKKISPSTARTEQLSKKS